MSRSQPADTQQSGEEPGSARGFAPSCPRLRCSPKRRWCRRLRQRTDQLGHRTAHTSHCTIWPRSTMVPHRQRMVVLAAAGARRPFTALPEDVAGGGALEPAASLALSLHR